MFEDEVEELMCDYGLSPMDARSIAKELRATKYALWMARALRASTECNQATNGVGKYSPEKWQWVERKCLAKAREFE